MRRILLFLSLIIILNNNSIFSQIPIFKKFELQDSNKSITSSKLVVVNNKLALFFWNEENKIYFAKSFDNCKTWLQKKLLVDDALIYTHRNLIQTLVTENKNIMLFYTSSEFNSDKRSYLTKYLISDSLGETWSQVNILPIENKSIQSFFTISQTLDGTIWIIVDILDDLYAITSNDKGLTWSKNKLLLEGDFETSKKYGSIQSINSDSLILFYKINDDGIIYSSISTDDGFHWNDPKKIVETNLGYTSFETIRDNNNSIYIVYCKLTGSNTDIYFTKNINCQEIWTSEKQLTNYAGDDISLNISSSNNKIWLTFSSERYMKGMRGDFKPYKYNLWYGIVDESLDLNTPPIINYFNHSPVEPYSSQPIEFIVFASDYDSIKSVKVNVFYNGIAADSLQLFSNNNSKYRAKYRGKIKNLKYHDLVTYNVIATNSQNLQMIETDGAITFKNPYGENAVLIDVNNIKIPITNNGVLADVGIQSATYDSITFLYSAGLFISGINDGKIYSSGQFSPSFIEHFQPGKINTHPYNGRNTIYTISSSDDEFGIEWQNWKHAVEQGANFYDGNNDGLYEPIDINKNGTWDLTEDRPDLLGDITAWCVYNDCMAPQINKFNGSNMGIEIKQTIFASKSEQVESLKNTIFVNYEIENKGIVCDKYDSVYFGIAADPDIGNLYDEDLVGCDTSINSGFAYKTGQDENQYGSNFGVNPPSMFVTLLDGPPIYLKNQTFLDNNNNSEFDQNDTPLDSTINNLGPYLGKKIIPGSKELSMTNFYHFFRYGYGYSSPNNIYEMRNQLIPGIDQNGKKIDVCNLVIGNGKTLINCDEINPNFMYSGNPVDSIGWLCTTPADTRMLLSTGPFQLKKNFPVRVTFAYTVGRGKDHLNSIEIAKNYVKDIINYYEENLVDLPVGIKYYRNNDIPSKFVLEQNYPNPFNPTTTIKYQIPALGLNNNDVASGFSLSNVELKVYDILGREVTTLVNRKQKPGAYEINFDASKYSSGVYYYQLKVGKFIQTKKMILLK